MRSPASRHARDPSRIADGRGRWNLSLSTFLRDYLYIPRGGNRRGSARTYANLATVMLLGGLWHGANWTFLAWGALHGALLIWERWMGKNSLYRALPKVLRIAITFVLVLIGWVFFRAENLAAGIDYLGSMLGLQQPPSSRLLLAAELYSVKNLAVMAVCLVLTVQPLQAFDWSGKRLNAVGAVAFVGLFVLALAVMSTQAFNPFLYFQF